MVRKKDVFDKLYYYINFDLGKCHDSEIFLKSTFEELGKFYFDKAINTIDGASKEILKSVILFSRKGNVNDNILELEYYYLLLCEIIGIKELPKNTLLKVQEEYDKIFIQGYDSILNKFDAKINTINNELWSIKNSIKSIESKKPNFSLIRDLQTEENLWQEYHKQCNELRTEKEMILFSKKYLKKEMNEFCDLSNSQNIIDTLYTIALDLSKDTVITVASKFSLYNDIIESADNYLEKTYSLFFKVKLYTAIDALYRNWHSSSYTKNDEERIQELEAAKAKIPLPDELQDEKNSNPQSYLSTLKKFMQEHNIIDELLKLIEKCVCLRERKELLIKSINLFKAKDFVIFNNIISLQIEGIFGDFLKDSTTFNRFSNMTIYTNDVLKEKIQHLQDNNVDSYLELIEYFMYYFNNIIRNRIAHGNYKVLFNNDISAQIFAYELILDLNSLVYMLYRKSETDKMYRFVSNYKKYYTKLIRSEKHPHFGALFNDMIGAKTIMDYDYIGKNRPIQVAYWLVNPYYERIYESKGDKKVLLELRADFLSKEFWEYVISKLECRIEEHFGYDEINMEFLSVVNGLFKCDITPEVKKLLGKVNALLHKIKNMQVQKRI
ncbi:hypothetical protein [Clostridium perfringens]|uniref:hypothetical protein n=1 Tax=Clostridium perfringens TaxID=1502 RepID=UPI0023F9EF63|nr:hypothetical protein [Clostridium perfringens]WEV18189.1 hypothetical protein PL323_11125 [Clostridium perfringens D]